MSLFITVGSTGFDQLIKATTTPEFLSSLKGIGINKVTFQYGASEAIFGQNMQSYNGPVLDLDGYKYKSSIEDDMKNADIIISHAGAGTILQALRLKNKKLIVVVNMALMDNHQYELANAMEKRNYAICSEPSNLLSTLQNLEKVKLATFPDPETELFATVVNEQMDDVFLRKGEASASAATKKNPSIMLKCFVSESYMLDGSKKTVRVEITLELHSHPHSSLHLHSIKC